MSRRRETLAALGVGAVAAVASTYPLVLHLLRAIPTPYPDCPHDRCADELLCVWILGEGGRRLYRDPLHLFEANIFHPFRHTLAYSESMLSAGALVAPINALTGNPILGYNLYYLATYVLSAVGVFLLVREVTGEPRAGLLAGWMFALCAERWEFRGLLPAVAVQWAPFVLWTGVRFLDAPGLGRGLGLAASLVAHVHANAYHGFMFPVLMAPWALVLLTTGPWPFRRWLLAAGAALPALAASLLLYAPYLAVRQELQFEPSVLSLPISMRYWGAFASPLEYAERLFTGPRDDFFASPVPLLLLGAAGAVATVRGPVARAPRGEQAHLAAALVLMLAAMLVSVGNRIYLGTLVQGAYGPFFYLRHLPGFASMRVPIRFAILASLAGAIVAGIATAVLLRRVRGRAGAAAVLGALAVVVLVDTRTLRERIPLTRLPVAADVPPVYGWLATTAPETAVVEFPYGSWADSIYMVYSLYHGRRLLNGYSAVMPKFNDVLGEFPDAASVRLLQDAGVRYAIVHTDRYPPSDRPVLLARIERTQNLPQRRVGAAIVFDIPTAVPVDAAPEGTPLDPARWQLEGSEPGAALAADGDLATHWRASARGRDGFLRVDLGAVHRVSGVDLRLGPHVLEYPRQYELLASPDGETWERVGGEQPTQPPLAAYRRDHRRVRLALRMRPVLARHLELRVPRYPASSRFYSDGYWGVHELVVYATEGSPE